MDNEKRFIGLLFKFFSTHGEINEGKWTRLASKCKFMQISAVVRCLVRPVMEFLCFWALDGCDVIGFVSWNILKASKGAKRQKRDRRLRGIDHFGRFSLNQIRSLRFVNFRLHLEFRSALHGGFWPINLFPTRISRRLLETLTRTLWFPRESRFAELTLWEFTVKRPTPLHTRQFIGESLAYQVQVTFPSATTKRLAAIKFFGESI